MAPPATSYTSRYASHPAHPPLPLLMCNLHLSAREPQGTPICLPRGVSHCARKPSLAPRRQKLARPVPTWEIAPALLRPGDCNARRAVGSLPLRLGRRKFVHPGQAADTFLRPEMPIPAPSHQGRLIHKSWSSDCDCDCGRCCVYLPIAYFARWCGCPSKACFDHFSLCRFSIAVTDKVHRADMFHVVVAVNTAFRPVKASQQIRSTS
jgi:hypothetical protein